MEYDGHDDEGFVTKAVVITSDGEQREVGRDKLSHEWFQPESQGSGGPTSIQASRLGAIVDFLLELLEEKAPGWEQGEGSFGTFVLEVEIGEYDLKHVMGRGRPVRLE